MSSREQLSFSQDIAQKLGISERTIERGRFTVKSNGDFADRDSFVKSTNTKFGISETTIKEDIQIAREDKETKLTRERHVGFSYTNAIYATLRKNYN